MRPVRISGGMFELVARAAIVAVVAGSLGYMGVCLADPAAWLAALIPIVPYTFIKSPGFPGKKPVVAQSRRM